MGEGSPRRKGTWEKEHRAGEACGRGSTAPERDMGEEVPHDRGTWERGMGEGAALGEGHWTGRRMGEGRERGRRVGEGRGISYETHLDNKT